MTLAALPFSTPFGFCCSRLAWVMIIILESASSRSGTRAARDPCPCHEQAGPPAVVVAAECISSVARQSIFAGGRGRGKRASERGRCFSVRLMAWHGRGLVWREGGALYQKQHVDIAGSYAQAQSDSLRPGRDGFRIWGGSGLAGDLVHSWWTPSRKKGPGSMALPP